MKRPKTQTLRSLSAVLLLGALLTPDGAFARKEVDQAPAGSALALQGEGLAAQNKFRLNPDGFEVIDKAGKVLKKVRVSGKVYDLLYFNRTLWLARGPVGVTPYDVSNPAEPRELATFCKGRTATRLASHQKSLLVIVADYVTTSYDITNLDEPVAVPPDAAREAGQLPLPSFEIEKLTFRPGGRGVEAVRGQGTQAQVVADVPLMGSVLDVLRIGKALFVARGAAGVTAFDLTIPLTPRRRATFSIGRPALRLAEQEGHLMVVVGDYTTLAFDVTEPERPTPVALVEQNTTVSMLGPLFNIPDPIEPPPPPLAKVVDENMTASVVELRRTKEQLASESAARVEQEKKASSRKWLWAGLGVLVGGAVAAGVATAVVLRPKDTGPPSGVMVTQVEF